MIELKKEEVSNKEVKMQEGKIYATGKRKNSIAKVWLTKSGSGKILINKKSILFLTKYFVLSLIFSRLSEFLIPKATST